MFLFVLTLAAVFINTLCLQFLLISIKEFLEFSANFDGTASNRKLYINAASSIASIDFRNSIYNIFSNSGKTNIGDWVTLGARVIILSPFIVFLIYIFYFLFQIFLKVLGSQTALIVRVHRLLIDESKNAVEPIDFRFTGLIIFIFFISSIYFIKRILE
jgi:hypothetical protein